MNMSDACINCSTVHIYDVLTLPAVCLLDCVLHITNRFINRNDVSKFEECSLKDRVGSSCTKTDFLGKRNSVASVELNIVLCDISLNLSR